MRREYLKRSPGRSDGGWARAARYTGQPERCRRRNEPLVDPQPDRRRTGLDRYALRRVLAAVCVGLALAGFIAAYVETGFHFEAEGGGGWDSRAGGERMRQPR